MNFQIDNWDDLRLFLAAVRAGSLTGAGRALGLDPTTVTRRVKAFEKNTGKKLFDRLRGGILLSPEGQLVLRGAEAAESAILSMEREVESGEESLVGIVRVAISELLAMALSSQLLKVGKEHPDLAVHLLAGDLMHNLTMRDADIALRVTKHPPEHLVGKRISQPAVAAYGMPAFLEQGIEQAPWIGWSGFGEDDGTIGEIRRASQAKGAFAIHVNTYGLMMLYLQAGAGLAALPCFLGEHLPGLVRMSEPITMDAYRWLLTHPDLQHTPRIRFVMDALYDIAKDVTPDLS